MLRLGVFHTACVMMYTMGKRFADAGLKDILIETDLIAEGSVTSVWEGRLYNRGSRAHKHIQEAMFRLAFQGLMAWASEKHAQDIYTVKTSMELISDFTDNVSSPICNETLQHDAYSKLVVLFDEYMQSLKDQGKQSQFWTTYIDISSTLLQFVRAVSVFARERGRRAAMKAVSGVSDLE